MVSARGSFLGAGHFRGLRDALSSTVATALARQDETALVVEAGAGTAYYLAGILDRVPDSIGIALDASRHALRRAANAHPRVGAVGCDIWEELPLRDACAAVVLDVFSPRNGREFRRILRPQGRLVIVTPTPRHLSQVVKPLGLISVDEDKPRRLQEELSTRFALETSSPYEEDISLSALDLMTVIGMGPSARHLSPHAIEARVAGLLGAASSGIETVTLSVTISVHRPV